MASAMTRIFDSLHRRVFDSLSLFGADAQGAILRRYFQWWHRKADPWGHATESYETYKYLKTLEAVPNGTYKQILEVGCSEGTFTRLLAETHDASLITGIDISERAISRAREQMASCLRVQFLALDVLHELPDEQFDAIFCGEILYYIGGDKSLDKACRELTARLNPDGLLVLVHPWPEAQHLYRYFGADPTIDQIREHVDVETQRPFAVTLYQKRSSADRGRALRSPLKHQRR